MFLYILRGLSRDQSQIVFGWSNNPTTSAIVRHISANGRPAPASIGPGFGGLQHRNKQQQRARGIRLADGTNKAEREPDSKTATQSAATAALISAWVQETPAFSPSLADHCLSRRGDNASVTS
ncbi:hypothetical protein M419DRAFT_122331 [Trichoderma reesei RUT C-30]|uniref:Uncharacterized protein n=1 Tax=Hypocrea jecorina (strain ATCC 56765 / BCRC 32924 / NRRL 11460 / Rut C-30) TaxID=1344414 RepID=A0A024SFQ2_HYPJR|nr:hypothetical protein M419DRAFT_122331 [Trichoderma reesei RUT C-30]